MGSSFKHLAFWMVAALVMFLIWSVSSRLEKNERAITFSDFMTHLERDHVASVTITQSGGGSEIVGELRSGQAFRTFAPPTETLAEDMLARGVDVRGLDANRSSWIGHLISWTPIVIMIVFLVIFMRRMETSASRGDPATRLRERQERRLEMKVKFFEALAIAKEDLFEDELLPLASSDGEAPDDKEARKALYEMLSDGTAEITEEKKYRLRKHS